MPYGDDFGLVFPRLKTVSDTSSAATLAVDERLYFWYLRWFRSAVIQQMHATPEIF